MAINELINIGIIIALNEEIGTFLKCIEAQDHNKSVEITEKNGDYCKFKYSLKGSRKYSCVAAVTNNMGTMKAVTATTKFIDKWNPEIVVMIGIAAALHNDVKLGDVIVATSINNYLENAKAVSSNESNDEKGGFTFRFTNNVYKIENELTEFFTKFNLPTNNNYTNYQTWQDCCAEELQRLSKEDYDKLIFEKFLQEKPVLHVGTIASGPVVSAAESFKRLVIGNDRKCLALEMEAAGFMAAVDNRNDKKLALVIRGISDRGDEDKSNLDKINEGFFRRYAMHNAVRLFLQYLDKQDFPYPENNEQDSEDKEYKKTEIYNTLHKINSAPSRFVINNLDTIFRKIDEFFSPPEANTFTLYDPERGNRLARQMVEVISPKLLSPQNDEKLSAWELGLLLLSAYLLDVCLTPKFGKVALCNDQFHRLLTPQPNQGTEEAKHHQLSDDEIEKLQKFFDSVDYENSRTYLPFSEQKIDKETKKTKRLAERFTTDYCREYHIEWTESLIEDNLGECFFYTNSNKKDTQFIDDLKFLCKSPYLSYNEVNAEVEKKDKDRERNTFVDTKKAQVRMKYLVAVLRTANSLAFDPVSITEVIWQDYDIESDKLIHWWNCDNRQTSLKRAEHKIELTIYPTKALLHHAIITVADNIDSILRECYQLFERSDMNSLWDLEISVKRTIEPYNNSYNYINGSFRVDTKKILDLLSGTELYGNQLYAVRELLQNAFDAVRERIAYKVIEFANKQKQDGKVTSKEITDQKYNEYANQYSVELKIQKDTEGYWLICTDQGVGMSKEIIENNLLVGGRSKDAGRKKLEREAQKIGFSVGITGQFGIGALSYFMLAEKVIFKTRRDQRTGYKETNGWEFTTEGIGLFGELKECSDNDEGTEVWLLFKEEIISQIIKENKYEYQENEEYEKEQQEMRIEEPMQIDEFVAQLKSFLKLILAHTPCKFRFINDLQQVQEDKLELESQPGWFRIINKNDIEDDIDILALQLIGLKYTNLGEKYKELLQKSSFSCLIWDSKYIEKGEIPESIEQPGQNSSLGNYRISLPYFELGQKKEKSLVNLYYEDEDNAYEQDNKILLKQEDFQGTYGTIQGFVQGEQIKFQGEIFSWKGMYVDYQAYNENVCLVEINLTSNSTGKLKANRNELELHDVGRKAIEYVNQKCQELIKKFLRENDKLSYTLLNYRLTSIPFSNETPLNWLAINGEQIEMQPLTFPLLMSSTYESSTNLLYQGKEIKVPPRFSLKVLKDYDDPQKRGVSWIEPNYLPSFSDKVLVQYLSEEEMGKSNINAEAINMRLGYLFTKRPLLESTKHPVGITSQFPENWHKLSCVETNDPSDSYGFIEVWNADHPLVKAIDADGWECYEKKLTELDKKDLKFIEKIQEIKEETITNKSYTASWIAKFLKIITWYSVFPVEEKNKKISEEWNEICDKEREFVKALWQLIFKEDKETPICKFISRSRSRSRIFDDQETEKLIVLTPSGWNEFTKQSDVEKYLPKPGSEWRFEVQQPHN